MTVIFYVLSLQLQLARNKEYQVEAPLPCWGGSGRAGSGVGGMAFDPLSHA